VSTPIWNGILDPSLAGTELGLIRTGCGTGRPSIKTSGKRAIAYVLDLLFVVVPAGLADFFGIGLVAPKSTRGLGVVLLIASFLWLLLAGIYNEVFR
jgi:hypothetical protein